MYFMPTNTTKADKYFLDNGVWEKRETAEHSNRLIDMANNDDNSCIKFVIVGSEETDHILAMIEETNKKAKKNKKTKSSSKWNKSEIMKQAHKIYACGGVSWSKALSESWRLYKLEQLEDELFLLNMQDRWSGEDYKQAKKLGDSISKLKAA